MEEYYTPGEFAKLFQIGRQTLTYDDNQGIFPHKDEYDYRQYSMEQMAIFSKILSPRPMFAGSY